MQVYSVPPINTPRFGARFITKTEAEALPRDQYCFYKKSGAVYWIHLDGTMKDPRQEAPTYGKEVKEDWLNHKIRSRVRRVLKAEEKRTGQPAKTFPKNRPAIVKYGIFRDMLFEAARGNAT